MTTIEVDSLIGSSTYSILTAEQIAKRLRLELSHDEIIEALKNSHGLYYQLLRIPSLHILNGIILQQAYDYQVYLQKLMVDYLLSEESSQEDGPAASIRHELEILRNELVTINEKFSSLEYNQKKFITKTQLISIELTQQLQKTIKATAKKINQLFYKQQIIKEDLQVEKTIRSVLIYTDRVDANNIVFWQFLTNQLDLSLSTGLQEQLQTILSDLDAYHLSIEKINAEYWEAIKNHNVEIKEYRKILHQFILKATDCIKLLPGYRSDDVSQSMHRAELNFDINLGE
ncbi:MAG: hypothetical protein ACOVQX_03525 [Legionella sp.]